MDHIVSSLPVIAMVTDNMRQTGFELPVISICIVHMRNCSHCAMDVERFQKTKITYAQTLHLNASVVEAVGSLPSLLLLSERAPQIVLTQKICATLHNGYRLRAYDTNCLRKSLFYTRFQKYKKHVADCLLCRQTLLVC